MAEFASELQACLAELETTGELAAAPVRVQRPAGRRRSSAWPIVLALAILIGIGAVAGYFILDAVRDHHPGNGKGGTLAPLAGKVTLKAITAYDPYGDHHEHDSAAPLATDGNPATFWSTEHYNNAPSLNKPGVGLVLDAGSEVQLRQLGFSTQTPGFVAEIQASNDPTDFATVVGASKTATSRTYYTIASGRYRYYLIWITRLPPTGDQAYINEVVAN